MGSFVALVATAGVVLFSAACGAQRSPSSSTVSTPAERSSRLFALHAFPRRLEFPRPRLAGRLSVVSSRRPEADFVRCNIDLQGPCFRAAPEAVRERKETGRSSPLRWTLRAVCARTVSRPIPTRLPRALRARAAVPGREHRDRLQDAPVRDEGEQLRGAGAEGAGPAMRILTAVVALTGTALLAASCGSPPRSGPSTSAATGALALRAACAATACRTTPTRQRTGSSRRASRSLLSAALDSSQHLATAVICFRTVAAGPSPARVQQVKALALEFSRCIRAHGVPSFPDPASDGRIPDPATVGVNQGSPKFEAANQACGRYRPPYMPSNAAYNAYARFGRQSDLHER